MIDYCRSCLIAKENQQEAGEHFLINKDIYCPLCQHNTSSIWHGESNKMIGDSYECSNCNNYIIYIENKLIFKEEFYFQGYFLIRSHNSSILYKGKATVIFDINAVIDNNQLELCKLKRLVPFV